MKLAEPTTTLTDYLIALAALVMAWRLADAASSSGQLAAWLWAMAFAATALAAALGGTAHGFAPKLGAAVHGKVWQGSLQSIALAGTLFTAGMGLRALPASMGNGVLLVLALQWIGFALWMRRRDDFRYVLYDYAGLMTLVLGMALWRVIWASELASAWIAAGVGVSFLAGGVQRAGLRLHRHFNHNDLYHLLQLIGLWLLYGGGMRLAGG